jgi:hypothetical protein
MMPTCRGSLAEIMVAVIYNPAPRTSTGAVEGLGHGIGMISEERGHFIPNCRPSQSIALSN